jgi:succinyl-CoA synthetase beta subunit
MKIHEYQAKAILAAHGVPVPRGKVAYTVDEAEAAELAREIAKKILGMMLITHQTGPEGRPVTRLLIEETLPIKRELYLGIVLDRAQGKMVFMASAAGGVEIEEVAARTPELILKAFIEPGQGLAPFQARRLASASPLPAPMRR